MYDTKGGNHARCKETVVVIKHSDKTNLIVCPHVSFKNPLSGADVPPRESVETRSVVITRE
jgi:hypothetical protein